MYNIYTYYISQTIDLYSQNYSFIDSTCSRLKHHAKLDVDAFLMKSTPSVWSLSTCISFCPITITTLALVCAVLKRIHSLEFGFVPIKVICLNCCNYLNMLKHACIFAKMLKVVMVFCTWLGSIFDTF